MYCIFFFNDLLIVRALQSMEFVPSLSDTESLACRRTCVNKESIA